VTTSVGIRPHHVRASLNAVFDGIACKQTPAAFHDRTTLAINPRILADRAAP
jgi:hypothetical protein